MLKQNHSNDQRHFLWSKKGKLYWVRLLPARLEPHLSPSKKWHGELETSPAHTNNRPIFPYPVAFSESYLTNKSPIRRVGKTRSFSPPFTWEVLRGSLVGTIFLDIAINKLAILSLLVGAAEGQSPEAEPSFCCARDGCSRGAELFLCCAVQCRVGVKFEGYLIVEW